MISFWRRRRGRSGRQARNKKDTDEDVNGELTIPNHFRCPVSLNLMKDPVTLSTGMTYDRESIETWIEAGNQTCPITNKMLTNLEAIPNHTIRKMIQDWCVDNQSYGIERIPTPRIPVSSIDVSDILTRITKAYRGEDVNECIELVGKIKAIGKESERNRRCIVSNGSGGVIAAAFEAFSMGSCEKNVTVLEEILAVLTGVLLPLDEEANDYLGSPVSLRCMVWFLNCGDLSARRNAVLVLKELLSTKIHAFAEVQGAEEALVRLIKAPVCPTTTKASLMVTFNMLSISSPEQILGKFLEMGLVPSLLEILVDSQRSICEAALGVLDRICSWEQGRGKAYNHALTMPVLVKKILRVSISATDFSVSILWNLCKNEPKEEGGGDVVVQALQVGAFQKLLLLIQLGCSEMTKDKATELLKLLNHSRDLECIDSMDFKHLKRPF